MTGPCHKGISLWAAFLAAGFASVRSFGNRSGGDGGEHLDVEIAPSLEVAGGDFGDGLAIVISGVARASEADTLQRYVCREGGLAHEGSNQVVSDEVHLDFFVDHGWGFAAEHVHLEYGFNVIPIELDFPAPVIERGQQLDWPEFGVGERGYQGNGPAAAVAGAQAHAHHADGQGGGQLLPLLF